MVRLLPCQLLCAAVLPVICVRLPEYLLMDFVPHRHADLVFYGLLALLLPVVIVLVLASVLAVRDRMLSPVERCDAACHAVGFAYSRYMFSQLGG